MQERLIYTIYRWFNYFPYNQINCKWKPKHTPEWLKRNVFHGINEGNLNPDWGDNNSQQSLPRINSWLDTKTLHGLCLLACADLSNSSAES